MSVAPALQPAAERLVGLRKQLETPCIIVDLTDPDSPIQRLEIYEPPQGPRPATVVRSLTYRLGVFAGSLDAETDAVFPGDPSPQEFHVLVAGRRVAVVHGMDLEDFIDAVIAVGVSTMKHRRRAD